MVWEDVPGVGNQKVCEEIHIDAIRRGHGDPRHASEFVTVFGWMNIAHDEIVIARDFELKTLEGLVLTCETGNSVADRDALFATKWIYNKNQLDNFATICIWNHAGTGMDAATYGSTHVNFIAWGEG